MLNKAICKRCIQIHCGNIISWSTKDEICWRRFGKVACYYVSTRRSEFCWEFNKEFEEDDRLKVKNDPPDECPYILEHILEQGKTN